MAQLLLSKSLTLCPRGLGHLAAKSLANLLHTFKRCPRYNATQAAHCLHSSVARTRHPLSVSSCLCVVTGRGAFFAFTSPLAFIRRIKRPQTTYEEEVLANIPKEVFVKDVLVKKKKKRSFIARLLQMTFNFCQTALRFIRLSLTFGPLFTLYPVTCLSHRLRHCWWHWMLWACEFSGPTFTKFGQWAGTRRDLFSEEFCDLFSKLHTKVKPHSWYSTRKKLTKAFGKNWTKIFIAVDRKPIGSGCIAQVHKGYMRSDMIPDESVIEEALDDGSDDGTDIDFSEGLEIIGFGHAIDSAMGTADDNPEYERSWRWWRQKGVPVPTTPPPSAGKMQDPSGTPGGSPPNSSTVPRTVEAASSTTKGGAVPADPSDIEADDEVQLIPVAIKVLHPGVFRAVKQDIAILSFVLRIAELLVPGLRWLSLPESIGEFSQLMTKQVDLRFECNSLEKFVDNFADNPNIRFPRPIRPYCKRDVLVETFEEGEHISNFIQDDKEEPLPAGFRETLATYGLDALLQMIFVDNLVHGDLHSGNILVQNADCFIPDDENKLVLVDLCDTVVVNVLPAENPVRLVMLDVGICASLSERDLENFKKVFTAIVIGEGEKVAELMLKHSTHNECKDIKAFKQDLGAIVMEARKQTIQLGKIEVGRLLLSVFRTLNQHRVKMESNFASIILAIFVLEGIGRSLDPEVDILERSKPILLS